MGDKRPKGPNIILCGGDWTARKRTRVAEVVDESEWRRQGATFERIVARMARIAVGARSPSAPRLPQPRQQRFTTGPHVRAFFLRGAPALKNVPRRTCGSFRVTTIH